jgi:hypothetical protein
MLLLLATVASAGSGPWVLSEGDTAVYLGSSYERIGHLSNSKGSFSDEVAQVDDGLEKFGVQGIIGYGIHNRFDLELDIPWSYNAANRTDGALCTSIGLSACETTEGIGVITGRAKALLLDELTGAPLSISLAAELRYGGLTNATRQRLTNLGEGTTDIGPQLMVGRGGGLGNGYWNGYFQTGWRYRFPNTNVDSAPIPGSEITADLEVLGGAASWWSLGMASEMLWRPEGRDIETTDFADPDRFGALRVFSLRAGGKLILRSSQRVSFVMSAMGTVYSENNPSDAFLLSAGLGFQLPGDGS